MINVFYSLKPVDHLPQVYIRAIYILNLVQANLNMNNWLIIIIAFKIIISFNVTRFIIAIEIQHVILTIEINIMNGYLKLIIEIIIKDMFFHR